MALAWLMPRPGLGESGRMETKMDRRQFVKGTAAVGAAIATGTSASGQSAGTPVEKRVIITSTAQFDPARPEMARLIAQACKSLGWEAIANPIDYNQGVQKAIMEHDFEMFLVALNGNASNIDPDYYIHRCYHSGEIKRGGFNWMGYKNPKVDDLAVKQQLTVKDADRKAAVLEAQQLIYNDQGATVLAYPQIMMAHRSDKLKGLVPFMGEGIGSFWSDINMEVGGDGYSRTGINVDLKSLNPVAVFNLLEFKELAMIYDSLLRIGPDGQIVPWAATKLTIVDDKTIDLTIRQDMKWHDGKPVTAEDVKFSFDYHKQWKAPYFLAALNNVASVEIPSSDTVRIKLNVPSAPFIYNVLAAIFIIPKHIWSDLHEKEGGGDPLRVTNEKPIGSGPFKFDYWRRGSELKVSAFKEHFNPPKCAGIIRIVYGSHDALAAALVRGECDRSRYNLSPAIVEQLKNEKNVVAKGYPNHGIYLLTYNNRIKPFDDPVFRNALNLIIPRRAICDLVLLGYAEPGASVISPVNAPWHNSSIKAPAEDVKAARDMLAKAGYRWNAQGTLVYPG